jgi:hypothetical protein
MKTLLSRLALFVLLACAPAWAAEPSPEARSFDVRKISEKLVFGGGNCVDSMDMNASPEEKAATRARAFRTFPKASELSFQAPSGFEAMTFRLGTKLLRSTSNRRDPIELLKFNITDNAVEVRDRFTQSANLFLASLGDSPVSICVGCFQNADRLYQSMLQAMVQSDHRVSKREFDQLFFSGMKTWVCAGE